MTKGGITLLCTIVVLCFIQGEAHHVQFPTHLSFTLRPKKWPAWHVVMGSDSNGVLHGDKNVVHLEGKFEFERINANQPYFYMKSTKWNKWYVYMTNTASGRIQSIKRHPGPEGIWKITATSDKMFTLSPKKWPAWYMCMQGNSIGTMIGCKNTPGNTGTFTVTLAEEESIFMYAILCY
jgi:hypothetical protein